MTNPFKQLLHRRAEHRAAEIRLNAADDIQVREFEGKLYVAYHGVPLIDASMLQSDITRAVQDARSSAVAYQIKREKLYE